MARTLAHTIVEHIKTSSGQTVVIPPPPPPPNQPPTALFTFTTSFLVANFTDISTDSDGTVESWSWSFGDGTTSTAQHPSRTYNSPGSYSVTLTITDDGGATASQTQIISVTSAPNIDPVASFSFNANALLVDFTDTSTDADGTVVSWVWDFGDSTGDTIQNPQHLYAAAGSYPVTLDITDNAGGTSSTSRLVSVNTTPPGATPLTPSNLLTPVSILVARNSAPTTQSQAFDNYFLQNEQPMFDQYIASGGNVISGNHYGGLRSRLHWAIRTGQPYGAGVTSLSTFYGRGRRIVVDYLQTYAIPNGHAVPPHNNTGMDDIEAYYRLEGDQNARNHIWIVGAFSTFDTFNFQNCGDPQSDARIPAVGIQACSAAHRLGIPYQSSPTNPNAVVNSSYSSWAQAGEAIINRVITGCVQADGSIPSPAHFGQEAFLFNALLAVQLLRWHVFVQANQTAYTVARQIMDHLRSFDAIKEAQGWPTLPYQSGDGTWASDLAAYYIWPAYALWQDTGITAYRTFALRHMQATVGSFMAMKQFNQVFSTGGHSSEAFEAGVSWRTNT